MQTKENSISPSQMASIHIAYRQWAEALNDAGYTVNKMIEQGLLHIDVPFTENNVKEIFGYMAIKILFPEKEHHTKLTTTETQLLFDTLNMNFGQKYGVSIPFPTREEK